MGKSEIRPTLEGEIADEKSCEKEQRVNRAGCNRPDLLVSDSVGHG
jgi:hypothetical protein